MKRICAILGIMELLLASTVSPVVAMETQQSFAAPESSHPRLFFTWDEIPTLRQQAQTTHQEIWEPILSFAEMSVDSSPPATPTCPDLNSFRNAGNQLIAFAFAYVITDDIRFFELTRRHMLGYAQWEVWGDEGHCGDRDLGFHHMLLGNSIAYDWLYNDLSASDRATIGTNLARRAQESYQASTADHYEWGNWWRRAYTQNHHWIVHSGLGMAALVLEGDDTRAQDWLAQAVKHLSRNQALAEGIADGSWHESLPYQSYGLTLSLPFFYNLRRVKGLDILPHTYLQNYSFWRVYNTLPGSDRFVLSYGDFEWSWGNGYRSENILRFVAREYRDGYAEWAAQHLVTYNGRHANVWCAPWNVFEFLYYDPAVTAIPPVDLPTDKTFPDLEGVIWRTGWGEEDLIFALKTGPYGGRFAFDQFTGGGFPFDHPGLDKLSSGHDHEDTNTFYLYRGNVDLSSEMVVYGGGETHYHNTLLIDGKGQYEDPDEYNDLGLWDQDPDYFRGADGKLEMVFEGASHNYLVSDATDRYRLRDSETGKPGNRLVSEYRRHVLWVEPDYLVMLDVLRADSPRRYEWVAHFTSSISVEDDWIKGVAEEDQVLGIKVLAPNPFATSNGEDGKKYIRVRPSSNVANVRFVMVLYPTDASHWEMKPEVQLLSENELATGVRLNRQDRQEDHLIRYGGSGTVAVGEYLFDARVAGVVKGPGDQVSGLFLLDGTQLADSDGDRVLLQCEGAAVGVEVERKGEGLVIIAEGLQAIRVYAPGIDVSQVVVNNLPVEATMDGDYLTIGDIPTPSFADVPFTHWAYEPIEILWRLGYTAGCNTDPLMYCPDDWMIRAESAVFVERGVHGTSFDPSLPSFSSFEDVPVDYWGAGWIESLWQDGYTAGCSTDPLMYCPLQDHTRAEGCVFYLRMMRGADYEPPAANGIFLDVPIDWWGSGWVEAAYQAGLIEPCETEPELRFCPHEPLSRALAAYMMVQAKGLE